LKYVNIGGAIGLALMIYKTHKVIWTLDMKQKRALGSENATPLSR